MLEDRVLEIEKRWKWRYQRYEDRLKLKENISNSKKHLDFGCEYGTFAKILAENYPEVQVYGIDGDKEKIEIGRRRYRLPNLNLIHSKKVIGTYDSISALFVLHELPDVGEALKDLCKHLVDGGRIVIFDFRKTSREEYLKWFERGRPNRDFEEEYQKHNRWIVKEFELLCDDSGFETARIESVEDCWLTYIGKKDGKMCSKSIRDI